MSEVFEPSANRQRPNVIGKIDLDRINSKMHPDKGADHTMTKEWIIAIPTREEIRKRVEEWHPHWKTLRQTLPNVQEYSDGQPLRVGLHNGTKGYAIGCLDPMKQTVGYYIAINLYGSGVITKISDRMMEDGVMAGEWSPETVKSITPATSGECDIINSLLLPQIERERELFRETIIDEFLELAQEQARRLEEERRQLEEALKRQEEERRRKEEEENAQCQEVEKTMEEEEERRRREDVIPEDLDFEHLPLSRREITLRNSNWPQVDREIDEQRYFSSMGILASILEEPLQTYVMSRTYVNFLYHDMKEQIKDFSTVRNMLGEGQSSRGVLCFSKWLCGSVRELTVPYFIGSHAKSGTEYVRFAIIVDGQMCCTYAHNKKHSMVQPYVTHNLLLSPLDSDYMSFPTKDLCSAIMTLILSHEMMERTLSVSTADISPSMGSDSDILIRTAEWYQGVVNK